MVNTNCINVNDLIRNTKIFDCIGLCKSNDITMNISGFGVELIWRYGNYTNYRLIDAMDLCNCVVPFPIIIDQFVNDSVRKYRQSEGNIVGGDYRI